MQSGVVRNISGSNVSWRHAVRGGELAGEEDRYAHLTNRDAELEGCENEGGGASDLGVAAGSWVVFEDKARVDVDGERVADSGGVEGSVGGGRTK
jgi:hypothetical protein